MSKVTIEDVMDFFRSAFPGREAEIPPVTEIGDGYVKLELTATQQNRRPPNYINGPTQMQMADHAAYIAVFTRHGITPMAVTSNLNIDFLRPCIGDVLEATATVLKGGSSVVVNVDMRAAGQQKLSSRATVTYKVPKT